MSGSFEDAFRAARGGGSHLSREQTKITGGLRPPESTIPTTTDKPGANG
jgi:hypothetical protein